MVDLTQIFQDYFNWNFRPMPILNDISASIIRFWYELIISIGWCKKYVTPLLTHWSYLFLALTHQYKPCKTWPPKTVFISYGIYCRWHEVTLRPCPEWIMDLMTTAGITLYKTLIYTVINQLSFTTRCGILIWIAESYSFNDKWMLSSRSPE